jgi:glycosyltransferase involved in cell wall biosynthesis
MSTIPTLSVCMPVYNAEQYVREATESILQQTFTDFEFIIIDDGSTDDSTRILEDFARKDARVRLVSRPNTGYTIALNEALALARAPYTARMEAGPVRKAAGLSPGQPRLRRGRQPDHDDRSVWIPSLSAPP